MNASTICKHSRFVVALAVCLCHSLQPTLAAPGAWTRKANVPIALDAHASCDVDGILYVLGGHKDVGLYTQLPTLFAYDPKTDSWTKADMPTARRFVAACAVSGIIYAIGGGGLIDTAPMDAVEAYDPQTDTWATKARLSSPRFSLSACAVDGIIYAIGGAIGATPTGFQGLTKVEAYDPQTDRWTPKANLPRPVLWGAASVVDGIIYVFSRKETFAYAPNTNRWTRKAAIPDWSLYSLFSTCGVVDGLADSPHQPG
jgi:N-acetylneuraminic acid mutarotase